MNKRYVLGMLLAAITALALPAAARQVILGPPNPGAEQGWDLWNHGANAGGYQSIDNTDLATGTADFTLGNTNLGRENHTDWRSQIFPLGPAAGGRAPITFSFNYKLVDAVKDGDNIRVQLRFYGKANNFISQKETLLGTISGESEMTRYAKFSVKDIRAPRNAESADVTMSANFYNADKWTSGTARFDDITVETVAPFPLVKAVVGVMALVVIIGATAWFVRLRKQGS